MERQKAVQIARALESLDSFEAFADDVLTLVAEWDDAIASATFVSHLTQLLDDEHQRRKKILEEM